MKRDPKVPSQVFSVLGPLPVSYEPLEEGTLGEINFKERVVRLDPELSPTAELKTYWHEVAHLVLWDSGVHNQLSAKAEENICDAFATYLAAAQRAGFIKVTK